MHIQVQPYDPFGRDCSWITQQIIEGYIFALIKGDRFAEMHIGKYAQGDPGKMKLFRDVVLDDPDFADLYDQIWEELELPEKGSIEYHIWQIERTLESPTTPPSELAKLYKILGEYRGWITKPGEGKATVTINNNVGSDTRTMTDKDAELVYTSLLSGNR